jgi:hypothetical protein
LLITAKLCFLHDHLDENSVCPVNLGHILEKSFMRIEKAKNEFLQFLSQLICVSKLFKFIIENSRIQMIIARKF